jgi:hypothetical protein
VAFIERLIGLTHLVDAATRTGAIVIALGHHNVGLFSNNDALRDLVLAAARPEGDRMWPMPLEEEYKDYLKSPFADLPNVGGRWGGAITPAMFLKEFAEDTPLGAPGHCRHRLVRRRKAFPGQRPHGCSGTHPGAPGHELDRLIADVSSQGHFDGADYRRQLEQGV